MQLNTIQPAIGSNKKKRRIGRGPGSGKGGTSTRGHKGAKSRSGYKQKIGFEGGQMPLQRRLPKFGFKPLKRTVYKPVNLADIEALAAAGNLDKVGIDQMRAAGLVSGDAPVKVLAKGALTRALAVEANAFSQAAQKAIEAAGGSTAKV